VSARRLGLIAAIALCVRVGYVLAFMRGYRPTSDADSYYAIGRAVSDGHGYVFTLPFGFTHATAIRPPLYPTVLAVGFRVFGAHVGVAQGVNVVAGSAVAVLGAVLANRVSGSCAGLCAGIVVALYPPLIANDVTLLIESIAVMLLFASVLFLADGRTVLAGISLGFLMLDRASAQWILVPIAAWVLWRMGWRHAVRLVVVALIVVSPWVIRNWVNVGGPVIVTTNGFNLNATYSKEAGESKGFVDAYFDPRFTAMRLHALDEVDLDDQLRTKALHDVRANPTRLFEVVRMNMGKWLELRPGRNRDAEQLDGRNMEVRHWTLPLFYVVTGAGIVALIYARRSATAQLLTIAALYFSIVCVLSLAVPRLRSVFDACVAVAAGIALSWLLDKAVSINSSPPTVRRLRPLRSAVALGVISLIIAASALTWRAETHLRARRAVETAAALDVPALSALVDQYHAGPSAKEPPRLLPRDLDRARGLLAVLDNRVAQVPRNLRPHVAEALRALRIASHEADVTSLLSAAEYLDSEAGNRRASLDRVRYRYEHENRAQDPSLETWDAVISGTALTRARSALDNMH
jgi:4-amino-4-deoxy-L-arabinose transferase-like glycosyltransferase